MLVAALAVMLVGCARPRCCVSQVRCRLPVAPRVNEPAPEDPAIQEMHVSTEPEIIEAGGFRLIGRATRASNEDPSAIGGLWGSLYAEPFGDQLTGRQGDEVYSVYCEYEGDHTQPYTVFLGYRVPAEMPSPPGLLRRFVPGGRFAKFVATGERPASVIETWQRIWTSGLERAYAADFEVHPADDTAPVDIFVGVK